MLAYRRADVAELNEAARALLAQDGRLGRERLVFGEREFRRGDRVVCRRNCDLVGVRSGTRGTLEELDRERRALTVVTDGGERRTAPPGTSLLVLSSTATRSPATRRREPRSSERSSWLATRARSKNGATSPALVPARRRTSTSPRAGTSVRRMGDRLRRNTRRRGSPTRSRVRRANDWPSRPRAAAPTRAKHGEPISSKRMPGPSSVSPRREPNSSSSAGGTGAGASPNSVQSSPSGRPRLPTLATVSLDSFASPSSHAAPA